MARRAPESGIPSRELFEKNPLPMWVYDLETLAFLAVNAAAVRHYGYSRRQFLAMTIKEIRPPEEIPALLEKVSRPVEGHDAAGTWRHRKKDGTVIDVEITTHSLRFAGRKTKLVLANDVTERTRLEQNLRWAAAAWRTTFDAMSDAVALIDRDGTIFRCNKAMTILTGKGYPKIIGRRCWEVVHGTSAPVPGCPVQEAMTTNARATATMPAGSRVFKVVADPLFDTSGLFIGAVHIMSDVTQQEQAEKILRDLVLQQEAILNNIPDLAWLKDDQGRFLAANAPFGRACGVAPADLVGKTDLDIWPRELAKRYRADDAEVMRSRTNKVVEEPLADKEGQTAWIETIKTPIIDDGGRVVGTTGIARDITARHRTEDALRRKEHLLSQAQRIAHIGSWEADFRAGTISWSDEMHHIYGTNPKTFKPTVATFLSIVHREDRKSLVGWTRTTTDGEKRDDLDFRIVRADGTTRWVRGSVEPVLDAAGNPVGAIGTGQDITERKQTETVLKASEEKFRILFETANDAIFIVDFQGNFIDANTTAHERLGYTREELLSKNVAEINTPEFAARVPERITTILEYGKAAFEAAHFRKDGTVMPVEISARVIDYEGRKVLYSIVRDITERKTDEAAILESEARYRDLFENASDAIFLLDAQQRFLDVNKKAEELTGYLRQDLQRMQVYDLIAPEQIEMAVEDFRKLELREAFERGEGRLLRNDGSYLDVEISSSAIIRDGKVVGSRNIVRDITERTQAEAAKNEQMRLAEFGIHIGTALNREGSIQEILGACTDLMVNDLGAAFARIWTVSPNERMLIMQASSGIYTHRDGPHGLIPLDKNLKIPTIARTRIPHLTNAVIGDPQVNQEWAVQEGMVAFAGYPLLVGNHLVGVMGLFSRKILADFTFNALESVANNIALGIERLQGEAALKRYSDELAALSIASNDLLALSSLPEIYDGICLFAERVFGVELVWLGLIDAGGSDVTIAGYAGAGEEYLRTLKVTLDDSPTGSGPAGLAIRSKQPWLDRKDTPEYAPWRAAAEKCGFETALAVPLISPTEASTCIGALNFYSRVAEYFTPDRVRLCQIFTNQAAIAIENARLIAGLEAKIAARTQEYEDANVELQHLNRELEQRRLEAESANRTKSDFLANMSHELRTPLNAIIGFSDIMVRGMAGPLAEKPKEYLGDILASGKHLLGLINDILDLSKVEAGKMEIESAEYDAADLIDQSLVLFHEKAAKHRLELRVEIAGTIGPMFGDERKIRQVLYNLLSNAVKFTPDGGSVIVRARTVRDDARDCAEISVSDTGIGIAPADQERLFQPFQQLSHHLTKNHEGTGLGLALCKSFIAMHGGGIRVESDPGRGSTFTFRIPLRYEKGIS